MSEPIKDRRELDKGEKSDGKFFETGADAAMALNAVEEVFDFVSPPIVAAMERRRTRRELFGGMQTRVCGRRSPARKFSASKPLSPTTHRLPQATAQGFDGKEIVALALCQSEGDGAPATLDDGRQLGVDPSFGSTGRLCGLSAAGIRSILVQLDGRTVEIAQFSFRAPRDGCEHANEQSRRTPALEARIDRIPRTKTPRQIPPLLTPGSYTVIVSGVGATAGTALVELYIVP
jgi:hypothetical protein